MLTNHFKLKELYFKKPAKLHYKYSAMNGGKSTALIQIAYNYRSINEQEILVGKPSIDTKGDNTIISRVGKEVRLECDFLIDGKSSITNTIYGFMTKIAQEKQKPISAILIDEAQFLNREDVEELVYISNIVGIPVICFGLRTDFRGEIFEGSAWLFAYAQDVEELTTRPLSALGDKSKKASMNLRLVNGEPSFSGEQVAIDGDSNVTYLPVTLEHFLREKDRAGALEDFGRGVSIDSDVALERAFCSDVDKWLEPNLQYSVSATYHQLSEGLCVEFLRRESRVQVKKLIAQEAKMLYLNGAKEVRITKIIDKVTRSVKYLSMDELRILGEYFKREEKK